MVVYGGECWCKFVVSRRIIAGKADVAVTRWQAAVDEGLQTSLPIKARPIVMSLQCDLANCHQGGQTAQLAPVHSTCVRSICGRQQRENGAAQQMPTGLEPTTPRSTAPLNGEPTVLGHSCGRANETSIRARDGVSCCSCKYMKFSYHGMIRLLQLCGSVNHNGAIVANVEIATTNDSFDNYIVLALVRGWHLTG